MFGFIAYYVIILIKRNVCSQNRKNLKFKIVIIIFSIIIADIGIRILTKKYRSYSEQNYGIFYISPFTNGFDLLKNNYFGTKNDNILTHIQNSNYTFRTNDFSYIHKYNSLGIRDVEPSILNPNSELILTFGDSYTEGVGTNQDSTWQKFLRKRLNDSSQNYEVINAGISGHDPSMSFLLYKNLYKIYDADIVILSISENDISDFICRNKTDFYNPRYFKKQPLLYYFYSWSYITRAVVLNLYEHPELCINNKTYYDLQDAAYKKLECEIDKFHKFSSKNSCKLIVFVFPDSYSFENKKYTSDKFCNFVNEIKSDDRFTTIDFLDYFSTKNNSMNYSAEDLYWPTDGHMKPLGYQKWSEIIYLELNRHNFL